MRHIDWRKLGIASLWAVPTGVTWFVELVFRDVDPGGLAANVLPWVATVLVIGGPVVAGWFWRGSGLTGAVIGLVVGTLAAWTSYRVVATGLSSTPISEYELGWTSFAAGVWIFGGLIAGSIAWGVSAARRRMTDRTA